VCIFIDASASDVIHMYFLSLASNVITNCSLSLSPPPIYSRRSTIAEAVVIRAYDHSINKETNIIILDRKAILAQVRELEDAGAVMVRQTTIINVCICSMKHVCYFMICCQYNKHLICCPFSLYLL
jgi:hypothetical protein